MPHSQSEHPQKITPLHTAYLLGILGVLIFSATLPVTVLALEDFTPWFTTFCRAMIAAVIAFIWLWASKLSIKHKNNAELFLAGTLLVFGFPGFMALGMQTVPASHGGVILGFLPMATALVARVITSEKPSLMFWVLSIVGALIVVIFAWYSGSDNQNSGFAIGDLWLLLASICAAGGYVISGKLSKTLSGHEVIFRSLILTSPFVIIGTIYFWEPEFASSSAQGVFAMLYLGLGSMCFGFFAWNTALAMGGIARIGQIQLLQIFFTLIISAMLLGEQIETLTLIAATAITLIIAVSRKG